MQRELTNFGLLSVFGDHFRDRHGYLADSDKDRAADFNAMFANEDVDGIMAVRGGWGCARILPYLDFELISRNLKSTVALATTRHSLMR